MSVVTIGDFDGVHQGHRSLLRQVVSAASLLNTSSVVVTFDKNVKAFLHRSTPAVLTDLEEKTALLSAEGVSSVCVITFDSGFSKMSASDFLKYLKERFGCTDLFGGEDFHFGNSGAGVLNDGRIVAGVRQHVVSLKKDLVKISSSSIRTALLDGLVEQANTWLGYPYSISGQVVEGKHLGRTIGFPTMNLSVPEGKVIPRDGVYITETVVNEKIYRSITNIGVRPTVADGFARNIETHLLNADGDFYGKKVTVRFLSRLRDEIKFSDLGALMRQLCEDRESAFAWKNGTVLL